MINRLFTGTDRKTETDGQSTPPDDDIHRFNELLDVIDRPVDTKDYEMAHIETPPKPTQLVVEVHKPKPAPIDPELSASTLQHNVMPCDTSKVRDERSKI